MVENISDAISDVAESLGWEGDCPPQCHQEPTHCEPQVCGTQECAPVCEVQECAPVCGKGQTCSPQQEVCPVPQEECHVPCQRKSTKSGQCVQSQDCFVPQNCGPVQDCTSVSDGCYQNNCSPGIQYGAEVCRPVQQQPRVFYRTEGYRCTQPTRTTVYETKTEPYWDYTTQQTKVPQTKWVQKWEKVTVMVPQVRKVRVKRYRSIRVPRVVTGTKSVMKYKKVAYHRQDCGETIERASCGSDHGCCYDQNDCCSSSSASSIGDCYNQNNCCDWEDVQCAPQQHCGKRWTGQTVKHSRGKGTHGKGNSKGGVLGKIFGGQKKGKH